MTPATSRIDDRLVVVAFDDRTGVLGGLSIAHRRGVYLANVAVLAQRAGAAAVVFVGFDGLALREGAADRSAIAGSEAIQRLGIAPLLDLTLETDGTGVPRAARYRVDELAADFAAIGLPLVPDGPVVRTVPALAGAPTLEPSVAVRDDDRPVAGLVYGMSVLGLMAAVGHSSGDGYDAAGLSVAQGIVPLEDGRLRIRWAPGLDDYQDEAVLPAASLLQQTTTPDWTGKVVVVGTTDPAHTPYYATPRGPMPEMLVHANALNTLLTAEYLEPVAGWTTSLLVLVATLAVALAWQRRGWRWAATVTVVIAVCWPALCWALAGEGPLLDPLRPPVAAIVVLAVLTLGAVARQILQRRRLAALFAEYVPAAVARDLIDSGRAETAQSGERLLVSVLFCDLRGFTPTAARLSPPDVRSLLDRYYEAYSQVVFDHQGTVLQYTGDEIFAVFGAPLPRSDHADAALACAMRMRTELPALNAHLVADGLPTVAVGIGLHSGLVVAAHVGSSIRRQYAVIGDPVNVGSRLCSQAGEHEIVYSQGLHEQLATPPPGVAPAGEVQLKGIAAPVTVYRLGTDTATQSASRRTGRMT